MLSSSPATSRPEQCGSWFVPKRVKGCPASGPCISTACFAALLDSTRPQEGLRVGISGSKDDPNMVFS